MQKSPQEAGLPREDATQMPACRLPCFARVVCSSSRRFGLAKARTHRVFSRVGDEHVEITGLEKIVNVLHSGSSKGAFAAIMLRFSRLHQNWLGNEGEANGRNVATTGGDDWLGLARQGRIRH